MNYLNYFKPKWKHSDWKVRRKAVSKLKRYSLLRRISENDNDERVREEATKRLNDKSFWQELAKKRRRYRLCVFIVIVLGFISRTIWLTLTPESDAIPRTSLSLIDEIIEELELGNIAFNSPSTLSLGDSEVIQLILSQQLSIEELQQKIRAKGKTEGHRIRVSNKMEARLSGPGFKIEAILPEVQAVAASKSTEWKWKIEATKGGNQELHLTLSALLYLDDQLTPYVIRTFERTINVRVTLLRRISSFVAGNWQWLWTAILIPVAGWIIHKRKRRRANKADEAVSIQK